MDGTRFDGITRTWATEQTRRHLLQWLAVGALGGLVGLVIEDAGAACIKANKKGCKGPRNGKCCEGAVCKGGSKDKEGRCTCKGGFTKCGDECVNTKQDRQHCGRCNNRCKGQNACKQGRCTSTFGCKVGQNYCNHTEPLSGPNDPRICGGNLVTTACICITDLNGIAHCSDLSDAVCATCTSNADCPDGFVCFDASGPNCNCDERADSNGNGCIRATCEGVKGSSTSRDDRNVLWSPRPR